jgi:hypothetical protein
MAVPAKTWLVQKPALSSIASALKPSALALWVLALSATAQERLRVCT